MDELAAHRGRSGLGEDTGDEDPGVPSGIIGHHRGHQPRTVGPEMPEGQVGQHAILQIPTDLLDDRVLAVGLVSSHGIYGTGSVVVKKAWKRYWPKSVTRP